MQITQIGLGQTAADQNLLKIDYNYGNNQQNNGSLRQQKVSFNGLANQITQDYTYDDLNRLKSAEETVSSATSWKQTFKYDRYGNREFEAGGTTTMISSKATNPKILTSNNQFKKDQDNDYVNDYDYDANGNLKLDADNQRYVFDAENRIKEFFKSNNNTTNNPNAIYEYDGEGKRVRKINDGTETIFVYNAGGTLVAEYSTELNPTPQVSYLTSDHLGSPRIVTDGAGAVISRHDYMAFGDEVTQKLGNVGGRTANQGYGKPDDVRKQYTGYERDKESGLDYAQARYYNSNHGRFTSVDPLTASASIRDPQTFNRYSYVLNSPYKFTDPLGLLAQGGPERDCGFRCRVFEAQMNGTKLSRQDRDLVQFHVANGTALGYSFSNAMQGRQQSPSPAPESGNEEGILQLNFDWYTYNNDDPDAGQVAVSNEVDEVLDDALSRMHTNIVNAMSAIHNLGENPKASTTISFIFTIQGSIVASPKDPAISVGGSGSGGYATNYTSQDTIFNDLANANDKIQTALVSKLKSLKTPTATQGEITLGAATSVKPYENLAANFGGLVRRDANIAARSTYNETFPKRKNIWGNSYPYSFMRDH